MESDAYLIEQIRIGSVKAKDTLCLRYRQGLFGYLFLMLGSAADAEDAVQETLLQCLKHLNGYREQGHFKAWLYRIGYRQGAKALKRRRRNPVNESDLAHGQSLSDQVDPARIPADVAVCTDESEQMRSALLLLPEQERAVVTLRIRSGLKFREIADLLDCPLNTVLTRMHKATGRLKQILGGHENEK